MSVALQIIISIVFGYLVGSINSSYIIAKIKGFDIRSAGSRNAGGSNAVITMGKFIGVLCCLFDIFKAYFVIKLCMHLFPECAAVYGCTAVAAILGHMFPFYMGFKGGKGLACLGGAMMAYSKPLFLIILAVEIVLVLIADFICVAPITASVGYPVIYGVLSHNVVSACILLIATAAMLYKHMENLHRIKQGTELHFSYLWHKDAEKERIKANVGRIDESQVSTVWRDGDED